MLKQATLSSEEWEAVQGRAFVTGKSPSEVVQGELSSIVRSWAGTHLKSPEVTRPGSIPGSGKYIVFSYLRIWSQVSSNVLIADAGHSWDTMA